MAVSITHERFSLIHWLTHHPTHSAPAQVQGSMAPSEGQFRSYYGQPSAGRLLHPPRPPRLPRARRQAKVELPGSRLVPHLPANRAGQQPKETSAEPGLSSEAMTQSGKAPRRAPRLNPPPRYAAAPSSTARGRAWSAQTTRRSWRPGCTQSSTRCRAS